MKKYLANIITLSRIIGACVLLSMSSFSPLFLTIYVFCGFTDFIDDPVARKTGSSSILGAALDTIGDVLTYLSMIKILIVQKMIPMWIMIWFFSFIGLFLILAFVSRKKFNKFYIPHTYLGKIFGTSVFVLPFAMAFSFGVVWLVVMCILVTVNCFECFYVQYKSNDAYDFVPTVFSVEKLNLQAEKTVTSEQTP